MTELERRVVWDGWFSAEVCAGYFAELSGMYRERQTVATWLTLALSSGAVVALFKVPAQQEWLVAVMAALAAIISLYSVVANNHQRATECADMHFRWSRLSNDYRTLWIDQHSEMASDRLRDLENRRAEISKSGTVFPNDQKRIRRWYEQVKESTAYMAGTA
jgi:hypothetical protein